MRPDPLLLLAGLVLCAVPADASAQQQDPTRVQRDQGEADHQHHRRHSNS